jgi:hypothetical protein
MMGARVSNVHEALGFLAEIRNTFHSQYRRMLETVLATGLPVTVCTIYDAVPNLPEPEKAALALFNEAITREASRMRVPVIDLRHLCNEATDYSTISPIEPSYSGGLKIARRIAEGRKDE